jgi:LacI family repressor for deo operon, udp, cdd, tsx, nupC, and nupG
MAGQINIKQVARAAEVSVATVSRALQMPDVVAPETLERVLAVIKELGYTPNAQARNLRTAKTKLVVVIAPDIASPFYAEVIQGVEEVAHNHGYSVMVGDTQFDRRREQDYAQFLASRQADGMITLLPHLPLFRQEGPLPIVNACEYVPDEAVTSVQADNLAGAEAATDYLLSLGHRAIGFVSGPASSPISVDRQLGYRAALQGWNIEPSLALEAAGDYSPESGIAAVEALFGRGVKFTALFCANDEMALGAISALRGRGLRVPQDVSVIGFDDIRLARYFDPPLTTVSQPMAEIGRSAMNLLLEKLADPNTPLRRQVLPTHLVVRGTTAPPPPA